MDIKDRIREGIHAKYQSFKDFCSDSGVNYRTLQHYLSGERQPSTDFLTLMTDQIGVSASWILTGKGDMLIEKSVQNAHIEHTSEDDFIQIQRFAVSASAGHGAQNDEEFGTGWYAFNRKWLERRKLSPKDLSVISVRGDSMEPKFSDKDLVLLDHAQNTPIDGFIYTIRVGNELYVKSIQTKGEDTIYMVSANPEYPPLEINKNDDAQIIGRVVASMHEW